jgi:hypothetical protein
MRLGVGIAASLRVRRRCVWERMEMCDWCRSVRAVGAILERVQNLPEQRYAVKDYFPNTYLTLHRYLAEFDFRYNTRTIIYGERAVLAVKAVKASG